MIDENKRSQYGEQGLVPNCITIHNTSSSLTAQELFDYLNNECKTAQGCHFIVDKDDVVEVMPLDWKTYHTGKGRDYAFHNSIAVEICSNINNEDYLAGQTKAIELIKGLMERYSIGKTELYFHIDWNPQTYCPADILRIYGNKKNFINEFFEEE